MILELDCGNSFIKWRVLSADGQSKIGGGIAPSDEHLLEELHSFAGVALSRCRLVSVRTDEETSRLCKRLPLAPGCSPLIASPAVELAGVRNGYDNFQRLGMDRWLALVAAYHLSSGACVVVDLGTAVTADLVSADGTHLGGFICPGMPLMRSQLRTHTRRIRYDDLSAERALRMMGPGKNTAEAVERGCLHMLKGFVSSLSELCHDYVGEDFEVFLTGGDALLVSETMASARIVPDLVFVGLAIACPFGEGA